MGETKVKLDQNVLAKITENAFGEDKLVNAIELTEGFCNTAYKLQLVSGREAILKISSNDSSVRMSNEIQLMDSEVEAMRIVSDTTDIPVPKVYIYDTSSKIIEEKYFIMECMEGQSLSSLSDHLSEDEKTDYHIQIGRIQKKLSPIKNDEYGMLGDKLNRFKDQYSFLEYMLNNVFEDAKRVNVDIGIEQSIILEKLKQDKQYFKDALGPSLVHWDMWEGNIFVKDGKVTGIIDWERAMWAEPLLDDRFRYHNQTKAFLKGFGLEQLSESQKIRCFWYDVLLYATMITETVYRQYEDDGQYQWAKGMFLEVWTKRMKI